MVRDEAFHLTVSMRSFRSENVSAFVKAVLDCDEPRAREMFGNVADRYPLAITRDLARAKQWIRGNARGSERYGLVASSKANRLKPEAIDVRVNIDPVHWFLNDAADTRSSYYLEDAATEFQVQGLPRPPGRLQRLPGDRAPIVIVARQALATLPAPRRSSGQTSPIRCSREAC